MWPLCTPPALCDRQWSLPWGVRTETAKGFSGWMEKGEKRWTVSFVDFCWLVSSLKRDVAPTSHYDFPILRVHNFTNNKKVTPMTRAPCREGWGVCLLLLTLHCGKIKAHLGQTRSLHSVLFNSKEAGKPLISGNGNHTRKIWIFPLEKQSKNMQKHPQYC